MDNCDFSFRGETLSSHGYMLCDFSGASSGGAIATDSQRSFTQMSMLGGKQLPILYYRYDTGLTIQLSICKIDTGSDMRIAPYDAQKLKRWLESPTSEKLRFLDSEYSGIYWEGTFNVNEYRISGEIYGFNIEFTATAPWGYKDDVIKTGTVQANGTVTIYDSSDDEGYIYPDVRIKILSAGDLHITNSFDERETIITDCEQNEVIHINHFLQLYSDSTTHDIYNCFNYRFMRIHNSYDNTENTLTFSLPCEYEIAYKPIAKAVFD